MIQTPRLQTLRARKRADHLLDIRDEIASALTHGLGAVLALAGGAVLITLAAIYGDGWQLAGAIVFGVALLLLYLASTLYHAIQHPVAKGRLKVFDHCAIYLLIAGTYTPFTLVGLRGALGWWLFGTIWTLALAGVAGFPETAARLLGAADRLREAIASSLDLIAQRRYGQAEAAARAALGDAGFDAAREGGRSLDEDQAVALAATVTG